MTNMFNYYVKVWLEFWLSNQTKSDLSKEWDDKGHPSIVPVEKIKPKTSMVLAKSKIN